MWLKRIRGVVFRRPRQGRLAASLKKLRAGACSPRPVFPTLVPVNPAQGDRMKSEALTVCQSTLARVIVLGVPVNLISVSVAPDAEIVTLAAKLAAVMPIPVT